MQSGGSNPVNAVRQTVTNPDSRRKAKKREEKINNESQNNTEGNQKHL